MQRLNTPTPPKITSGVPYYGYRFYNPELGRWLNRDPIEEEGALQVGDSSFKDHSSSKILSRLTGTYVYYDDIYTFVDNNSLAQTDYLGLSFGFPLPPGYGSIPGRVLLRGKCPEGQRWVEKPGVGEVSVDGCSVPRWAQRILPGDKDNPMGHFRTSFKGACDSHDRCYGECSRTEDMHPYLHKKQCDDEFYDNMIAVCERAYQNISGSRERLLLWSCKRWARYYHDAVEIGGVHAYMNLNQIPRCHCSCE